MTNTTETPTAPKKPNGVITTKIDNHTFITKLFFNHDSRETFQDKLLKVILADLPMAANQKRQLFF